MLKVFRLSCADLDVDPVKTVETTAGFFLNKSNRPIMYLLQDIEFAVLDIGQFNKPVDNSNPEGLQYFTERGILYLSNECSIAERNVRCTHAGRK